MRRMKEKATIYDLWRICRHYSAVCSSCPLCGKDCVLGIDVPIEQMDEMNEIILKWCKEHPIKTRQDKFLEMFPNVQKNNKIIDICPKTVDKGYSLGYCNGECCNNCRKSYWLAEVEE